MAAGPLSDNWERGDPYEQYVGRWNRQVTPAFLEWLSVPASRRWLGVGCGTGALSSPILERCAPAALTGVEPPQGFLATAAQRLGNRATLHQGDAQKIPLRGRRTDPFC